MRIGDLGNGCYRNPILYADYSDPDPIRVGDDYYLISSSFTFVPGIPVLHSKDLVNWKIINYVVKGLPFPWYDQPCHGAGTWAPSIRYHDGTFYVCVGLPDEGIFMSTTKDPFGDWSPLKCIKEAKGWIDPCPFWDDNGDAYLVHAFARSRCGIKNVLDLCRMSPDGSAVLDEGVRIYDGTMDHPTMEGPKMYKREGYYYIFTPAGGVKTGWQTVLRSKDPYGPYEDRIVLHQGPTTVNGPHQGGWVDTPSGEYWFLHFQDVYEYGRIVHLQPMKWKNGWPFIGTELNGDGIGEPVSEWKKPSCPSCAPIPPLQDDEFNGNVLGLQWQWQANPKPVWYSLGQQNSCLRLYAARNEAGRENLLWYAPNFLSQLIHGRAFSATAKVSLSRHTAGDKAGLAIIGLEYGYLCIRFQLDGSFSLQTARGHVTDKEKAGEAYETIEQTMQIPDTDWVYLRVEMEEDASYHFSFSFDGLEFAPIGGTHQAKAGAWTGARIGIFCLNDVNAAGDGSADFDYIRFEHKNPVYPG